MKRLVLLASVLCLTGGMASAQNLLVNGDFALGENDPLDPTQPNDLNAVGWSEWNGGGWNNREANANGLAPGNYYTAIGGFAPVDGGIWQYVAATEHYNYTLSFDAGDPEGWWRPKGEGVIEFRDAADALLGTAVATVLDTGLYDTPLAWDNYSVTATAPAGTTQIRTVLMFNDPGNTGYGGTMRFDNAVLLEVVPEPTTAGLLMLGSLLLVGYRARCRN